MLIAHQVFFQPFNFFVWMVVSTETMILSSDQFQFFFFSFDSLLRIQQEYPFFAKFLFFHFENKITALFSGTNIY